MKPLVMTSVMIILVLLTNAAGFPADRGEAIVSTGWLADNLNNTRLIIADIRKVDEYKEGHIPGSVNVTYNAWRTTEKGISCQLPFKEDIEEALRSAGIGPASIVVIVGKADTDLDRAHPARVAWTMKYAGIANIAILDGGYNKWKAEDRPTTGGWVKAVPSSYCCNWNKDVLCSKECLKKKVGRITIVDTRLHRYFSGKVKDPGAKKKGHIPGSVNLPYAFAFKKDGTFQDKDRLARYAVRSAGKDKKKELVVLCCTGRYSPTWWFLLSEVLGYENVSIYDGSMEEWCADVSAPMTKNR